MPIPPLHHDSNGNEYFEVANIRITRVMAASRPPSKNWSGGDTIRVQGIGINGPIPGAEFSVDEVPNAVQAMLELFQ